MKDIKREVKVEVIRVTIEGDHGFAEGVIEVDALTFPIWSEMDQGEWLDDPWEIIVLPSPSHHKAVVCEHLSRVLERAATLFIEMLPKV